MASVSSELFSSLKNMRSCAIVDYRLVALDQGQYRRQIEHFEYYWGLQKGDIDLASILNHIRIREDMACRLRKREWIILPSQRTLEAMYNMANHNRTSGLKSRRRYFEELCDEEFEYDFVPLQLLRHGRVNLYVDHGNTIKAVRAPYKAMPRIRSRAHPCFVTFLAFQQLNKAAALVWPVDQARAVLKSVGDIVGCWMDVPPTAFLDGPDVWQQHRHPLTDYGHEDTPVLCSSNKDNVPAEGKLRQTTQAPCKQPKVTTAAKPYARVNPRPSRARQSALPLTNVMPDIASGHDRLPYPLSDLRAWISDVGHNGESSAEPYHPASFDDEASHDEVLARYRNERARDADNALDPLTNVMLRSGLIIGDGLDLSAYSSNNWARRIHGVCLLGANPFGKAKR